MCAYFFESPTMQAAKILNSLYPTQVVLLCVAPDIVAVI